VVNVTPLLRELIVRTNLIGALDSSDAVQKRLMGVIFDELRVLTTVPLQLPLPSDPRAVRFTDLVAAAPDTPATRLLRRCGASRRTPPTTVPLTPTSPTSG